MKKILIILLTILLLTSCGTKNQATIDGNKNYSLPEYYHYEPSDFYKKCDELKSYIENNDKDKALELYDNLFEEAKSVYDLTVVCYIKYCEDVNNQYYIDEQQYIETTFDELNNKFLTLCHLLTQSSFAKTFKKHIDNEEMYLDYEAYEEMSQEELDLLAKENELQQKSNEIRDTIDDYIYTYKGKDYLYSEIMEMDESNDLYPILVEGVSKKVNDDLGKIYVQLVEIRDKIAKLNDYDNYSLYADEQLYYRDYTKEDLDKFKAVVKEHGDELFYFIYNSPYYGDSSLSGKQLINEVMPTLTSISPYIKDAYDVFENNKLYSITYGDGRYQGSYETSLASESAFIFINMSQSDRDYFTLAHEFGHFTNAILVNCPSILTREGCYDVFEIHSTGLEMLFGQKALELFGEEFNDNVASDLSEALYCVLEGCIYDEFQRKVYENPDMTLDEINNAFKETMKEYGLELLSETPAAQYDWMYVPHNFDSPMYYISYATSAYAALQIWEKSLGNYNKAVKIWENILAADVYNDGYVKIVSDAGLTSFTNKKSTEKLFDTTFEYLATSVEQ